MSLTGLFVLLLAACGGNGSTINPDQITLRYAGWNLGDVANNNIERQMLAAYQVANPNVKIEIIERPFKVDEETGDEVAASWDEFFATQAAIDTLPDLYMVYNLAEFTAQGWTEELTDLFMADVDFDKIPSDIRASAAFNNRYFAIPQSLFYFGFFINRTAINRVGPRAVMPTY
jgi:ABC-type glycerol-3-phosphate transport system substrate-binding protein